MMLLFAGKILCLHFMLFYKVLLDIRVDFLESMFISEASTQLFYILNLCEFMSREGSSLGKEFTLNS